jgi:hypothetical protein
VDALQFSARGFEVAGHRGAGGDDDGVEDPLSSLPRGGGALLIKSI